MNSKAKYRFLLFILIFLAYQVNAQIISVSGFVYHKDSGNVIKNVSVFEKQSGIGTITDSEGHYKLLLKPGMLNIDFSINGYEPYVQSLELRGDTLLQVFLVARQQPKLKKRQDILIPYNPVFQPEKEDAIRSQ